jgi:hypothetical protein
MPIARARSPAGIQSVETRPITKHACCVRARDRVGCVPCARNPPKPHVVFAGAVEPDDRAGEHLPLFGHAAIVGPPLFHTGWNDLVVEEIVAGRPDRMVIGRIPVVAAEGFQPRSMRRRTLRRGTHVAPIGQLSNSLDRRTTRPHYFICLSVSPSSHPRVKRFTAISPKLVVPQQSVSVFQSFKNDPHDMPIPVHSNGLASRKPAGYHGHRSDACRIPARGPAGPR